MPKKQKKVETQTSQAPQSKALPKYHPVNNRDEEPTPRFNLGIVPRYTILGVLLFFLMALQGGGDDVFVGIVAAGLFLICSVGARPLWHLKRRLSLPVLSVAVYFLLNAAASLYTKFGSAGAADFGKILAAFCVFALAILRGRTGEAKPFVAMLSAVTAVFALVSIDASSWGVLTRLYVGGMDALGCAYSKMIIGYEPGIRVTGVFGNANILAGMLAIGIFLALYLLFTAKTARSSLGSAILLGMNTVGFLLAFSMGAIGMFTISALIYLILAAKQDRIPLFVLMVETAILSLLSLFLAFPGLGQSGGAGFLTTATPVLCGVLLWVVHWFVGRRLSDRLNAHSRIAWAVVGGLTLLLSAYVVLGYHMAGGYTLASGESLRRSVYPAGGEYRLLATWDGFVDVTIESQNGLETITHTSTVLYSGPIDTAIFTVPEDSKVVYFTFWSAEGAQLDSVTLTDGPTVKLGYTLLPAFVANRIQGLWANQNAIQRTEFFMDGLRIYAGSPVIGNGLGSVNGLVTSVQRFYYESRYVHNHYIQVLAEMGIPGLLAFLAILGTTGATLLLRRKENADPLLPALGAALAMMTLHGATEAVWSIGQYQTTALLVVALIAATYGKPLNTLAVVSRAALVGVWLVVAVSGGLLFGNWSATRTYKEIKNGIQEQTPYTMGELAKKDRYNWAQYKLDMAVNAAESEVPEFAELAAQYAQQLRKLNTYSINRSLALYHYLPLGEYKSLFEASREGILQVASRVNAWQNEFTLYETILTSGDGVIYDDIAWFVDQVLLLVTRFEENNVGRLEQLTLLESNTAFLARVQSIKDSGATGNDAIALLMPNLS